MKSAIQKVVMIVLLGFITLFIFGMSGAGLAQSAYPVFMETLWLLLGFSLAVSFIITALDTFKNVTIAKLPWSKKIIYLPRSLFIAFGILVVMSTALELVASLL